ncbi:uncharacterized protein LOC126738394 [Anthonomus grandis grandis]|uniref:uncharacterized protein LOC126738394 n=1 Tax=Anthonomus grandis grandis TaxID=2921223 RepID=UPI002165317C|nr:uncharacterized protein LOC126738394 [Anthonomus grandis grandis]
MRHYLKTLFQNFSDSNYYYCKGIVGSGGRFYRSGTLKDNLSAPIHHRDHHTTPSSRKLPKTPDLIYVPRLFKWLRNKLKFKMLQNTWDPEFSEGAFIYGTTRAVCKITDIINRDKPEELENLLTFSAKMKLVDYMTTRLNKTQKEIIALRPDDIKILVPLNVSLMKNGQYKNCRVTMRILGLKWHEHSNMLKLVLVALQTEFLRDYSQGHTNSEWTISAFDVLECGMLTQIPS